MLQLDFIYDAALSVVGYTIHNMDPHQTFGQAIREMCDANAWQVGDWDFMFHERYHVPRAATPSMMGSYDGVLEIYCLPVHENN